MLHLYITILQNNKIRDITDNIYNYIYIYIVHVIIVFHTYIIKRLRE